jgi:hypothetical protein
VAVGLEIRIPFPAVALNFPFSGTYTASHTTLFLRGEGGVKLPGDVTDL